MTSAADRFAPTERLSPEHHTLYSGKDIALDVYDGGHPISIITFEYRNKHISATIPGRFGPGFGRGRFAPLGFNEYLVRRNRNHWYQTAEMDAVAEMINARTQGTRVITYGSSMGAFAAINFAERLNADAFVAVSPMHDVSPGNEAGDQRWPESRELDFSHNLIRSGHNQRAHGYVFYTRGAEDEAHAELIRRDTRADLIPVEYGGHPCSFFVNAAYGLKRVLTEVAAGTFDVAAFERDVAIGAAQTFYPYERRAAQLGQSAEQQDLRAAVDQMRIAVAMRPDLPRLHNQLGGLLRRSGVPASAEDAYRSSLALQPRGPEAHIGLSYVHASRGDYASAVDAVDAAIAISPKHQFYSRRGEWLILAGDFAEAERAFLKVVELVPDATEAPKRLKAIRDRRRRRRWMPGRRTRP